ncbi:hypothetical protein [Pectobacterium carotovorum]|uniref:Uncharacterized protein n=1 Tax=Pectobacterium carotovorum TaxID=554 RepID=A0A419AR24_PECCA|nr:hypothetical protein [Pectobacterium carotovorum]RJL46791.1 hypothetical protein D5071_20225 [Pectobacterium carotovorum]
MPQSVTQYRRTVGDHVNWSDKQQGNQEKQNKRIRQLATQPGCHTGNRDRQQVAYAAIQLLSVLSSVQNIEPNPAITVRRADALRAKEKVAHADKLCLGKMVEQGVSREAIRHADTNFRAENSLKTQGGLCKQPGVFVPREDKSLPDQIQPPDNSLSTPHSASERAIPPSACENAVHVANGENIFSAILDPLANALYETGQFISQFDPLKFPIAAASALPLSSVSDKKTCMKFRMIVSIRPYFVP